jgi:hypothetical protein
MWSCRPRKSLESWPRIGQHPYVAPDQTEDHALPATPAEVHFKSILALLHSSFGVIHTRF